MLTAIDFTPDTRLLVLSGAGASAESGVPVFRGKDGLWNGRDPMSLATPEAFAKDPGTTWAFYSDRRRTALACQPNPGHLALAGMEHRLGERFLHVTQCVDGLLQRAGARRVEQLHGALMVTRCSNEECPASAGVHDEASYSEVPTCTDCGANLRPGVTWFGEPVESEALGRAVRFIQAAEGHPFYFLAVGTSGQVLPAALLVKLARAYGAHTVLVNVGEAENSGDFDTILDAPAGQVLPRLLGA